MLVAHACTPSHSGGRDQENHVSKPAQANSSTKPCLKKPFTKIGLVEWLKVKDVSSSPSTAKKKKEKNSTLIRLSNIAQKKLQSKPFLK
jgi:hypothetical protein